MQALGMAAPKKKCHASPDLVNRILRNATHGASASAEFPNSHLPAPLPVKFPQASCAPDTAAAAVVSAMPQSTPAPVADATQTSQQPEASATAAGAVDAPGEAADAHGAAEAAAAAAAALQALESGQHHADAAKRADLVRVVEKRNFAGQEVEMEREVVAGSKAAQMAQERAAAASNKSGLDAALANMSGVPLSIQPARACISLPDAGA